MKKTFKHAKAIFLDYFSIFFTVRVFLEPATVFQKSFILLLENLLIENSSILKDLSLIFFLTTNSPKIFPNIGAYLKAWPAPRQ